MSLSLQVSGLHKVFKVGFSNKTVLPDLSFSVYAKRTTGFIGVNGAGKTTTLKCVLGFVKPTKGEVHFFDNQILSSDVKQKIGYLPERPYYYDFLSAREFLKFHWDLSGGGADFETAGRAALARVDLKDVWDKRLRSFSKGMLQRVGMAQALLRSPEFLILDEPMSGLDPDGRILIKDIIRQERAKGTSIFFSSHLLNDMDELCDDLVVIDQGKLIYQGPLKQFAVEGSVEESFRKIRNQLRAEEKSGVPR